MTVVSRPLKIFHETLVSMLDINDILQRRFMKTASTLHKFYVCHWRSNMHQSNRHTQFQCLPRIDTILPRCKEKRLYSSECLFEPFHHQKPGNYILSNESLRLLIILFSILTLKNIFILKILICCLDKIWCFPWVHSTQRDSRCLLVEAH